MKEQSKTSIFKLITTSVLLLSVLAPSVNAKSKTGLASTLIVPWESEVDRKVAPDFRYPSHKPSITSGAEVYKANCAKCHGAVPNADLAKLRKTSPEKHFEFLSGGKGHSFAKSLTVDERWDSLMYFRASVLGYYKANSAELASMDSLFGGNCAICHGTRGQGDGNLHKSLYPPPANFQMFKRLYTRTDERLFNEITHGIPWTAMPAWKNRYDFDKKVNFDQEMIWKLVRYVRQFAHTQEIDRLDLGRKKLEDYKKTIGEKN